MKCFLLALLIISSAAFAQGAGEWVQVKGGSWEPDAATLSITESKLRSALGSRIGHKVSPTQWHRYVFQYQGILTPQGLHIIHLNALCADLLALAAKDFHATYDFTADWLRSGGGGSCFFVSVRLRHLDSRFPF